MTDLLLADPLSADIAPFFLKSISHRGTLASLSRAVLRGVERKIINIAVAGGSVSVGSGCDTDPQKRWYNTLRAALRTGFALRGSNVDVHIFNAAQGATGPQRFAYCADALLPTKADILILEYAINEKGGTWSEIVLRHFSPLETSILFLETFSLRGKADYEGFQSSQMYHDALARYYDIPVISARDAFRSEFSRNKKYRKQWFSDDNHHPSCAGHMTLGLLVSELVFHVLEAEIMELPYLLNFTNVPLLDLDSRKLPSYVTTSKPQCLMASSRLAVESRSFWLQQTGPKPTYDCSSPESGRLSVSLTCDPEDNAKDFCQLIVAFTRSWQRMGSAKVFFNSSKVPAFEISGFAKSWYDQGIRMTIQAYTGIDKEELRLPRGNTTVHLECTGSTSAPFEAKDFESPFSSTTFQLHGLVIL